MKTYQEILERIKKDYLPAWYTLEIHTKVSMLLAAGNKLLAVKFLCDESTNQKTRSDFGLREAKDLCDEISPPMFKVPAPNEIPIAHAGSGMNRESLISSVMTEVETMDYNTYNKGQLQRLLTNVPTTVLLDFLDSI